MHHDNAVLVTALPHCHITQRFPFALSSLKENLSNGHYLRNASLGHWICIWPGSKDTIVDSEKR